MGLLGWLRVLISIHALLAESDVEKVPADVYYQAFLSTLSLRRATWKKFPLTCTINHFYPRSPCGERPRPCRSPGPNRNFYPRSPCGERQHPFLCTSKINIFLSTLSLRRATYCHRYIGFLLCISIHALLAESDKNFSNVVFSTSDFYPRSPCGERLCGKAGALKGLQISIHALLAESDAYGRINDISRLIFLSTLSLRRATGPQNHQSAF